MTETTFVVTGMTCQHCVSSVTEELSAVNGVREVAVDLPTGQVTVHSDRPLDDAELQAAVTEAGYQLATL